MTIELPAISVGDSGDVCANPRLRHCKKRFSSANAGDGAGQSPPFGDGLTRPKSRRSLSD